MSDKKEGKLSKVFGTYTPAPWMNVAASALRKVRKIILISLLSIVGLLVLGIAGIFVYSFIQSKIPVQMMTASILTKSFPYVDENPKDSIGIDFGVSAVNIDSIGEDVTSLVQIKPAISGSWRWISEDEIRFEPAEPWQIGKLYEITLSKQLFPKHLKIDTYTHKFKTPDFNLEMGEPVFTIDDVDPSKKYITFTLNSNYPIDPAGIEEKISFVPKMNNPSNGTLEKRRYAATVGFDETKTIAYVASEPLGVPAKDVEIEVSVASGIKSTLGGSPESSYKSSVLIPGMSNFVKISSCESTLAKNEREEYEQVIVLESTAKFSSSDVLEALSVYVLPADKPSEPGMKEVKNIRWTSYGADQVTDAVLAKSRKIKLTAVPSENEYQNIQSFIFSANPSEYIYIKMNEGTKFYGGYFLPKTYEAVRQVKAYPIEIDIISEGDIISMNGSHQIPVLTRGINQVDFSIWRMKPDEINHIVSQSNGDIKNFRFSSEWRFSQDNVSELYKESRTIGNAGLAKPAYTSFDFSKYLQSIPAKDLHSGLFLLRAQAPRQGRSATRLIMVTDQGLIVKNASDGKKDIFVQSISTGRPLANSAIKVVALNGNVLASAVTASDGHVTLPALNTSEKGLKPVAITATLGNDFAFIPYEPGSRLLDYSDFDTGGEYGASDSQNISAYIFSDRGIYRPGEDVRLGAIVKSGDWSRNLTGLPLVYTVTDSKGSEIAEKDFTLNAAGFEEIIFKTKAYSPTGEYVVTLFRKTIENGRERRIFIGSETVKVEEFLPDTLTINAAFDPIPAAGWIQTGKLTGSVKLKNLFGTDAAGNTVKAEINLTPGYMGFNQFRSYRFSDPYLGKNTYSERLEDKKTDSNGRAEFDIDVQKFAKASYRLLFTADGYEKESGRSVTANASVYVSPLEYLIGVRSDGDLSYIRRGTERNLHFIAVSPELKQIAVNDIELTLTENRYVSVLVREPNGVYKYQSVKKEFPIETKKISIPASGFTYKVPSTADGDFVLTIKNKDGLEFNHTEFSIIGEQNLQRSLSRTAALEVKAEKTDFKPGETARVFIKAPYAGSGLITVERDKVYAYKWFTSDGSSSIQSIQIPADLEGNGYINIMYTRSYNSTEIYMNPFCYAALPFSVDMANRKNTITIDVPQEAKPGTDYTIKYSSSKKGKIVIMAVDEGILQVAKYQTPSPLSFFYKKRALEVRTSQLLDLILPEFSILKKLGAAGGGADYEMLSHNLNPFKRSQNEPVAYWSGIIDTDSTTRSVTYHIPDYFNGSMRVMAVAVNGESVGVSTASSEIKDTYIIMPNVPTFASPSDTFDVSVTVTNNDKGTGENALVKVSAITNGGLLVSGSNAHESVIPEGKDATFKFTIQAAQKLGDAGITFVAEGHAHSSKMKTSLSVRPSVPYQVWLTTGAVRKAENKKDTVDVAKSLYDEYAERTVSLSYLPSGLAKGLEFYLEKYPYGCAEQITSKGYPYLFPNLLKESGKTRKDAQEAVDNVVSILASRQKSDGSIGYWTYKSQNYPAIDAYCAMFLTDARIQGYYVPESFFNRLLGALKKYAENGTGTDAAFSTFVLTRNEMVTTSYIERLKKSLEKEEKLSMAGMYLAASYKMLQMESEGKKLLSKIQKKIEKDDSCQFYDTLYSNSLFLYLVSEYYPEQLSAVSTNLLEAIEEELSYRRYSSFSSAVTLMGIQSYLKAVPGAASGTFTVSQNFGKDKADENLNFKGDVLFTSDFASDAQKLLLQNNAKTSLFYQVTQAGFLKDIPQKEEKSGIEIHREFFDENHKKISSAKLGDHVTVEVSIRSINGKSIDNVAIVDMLPAGLESDIESVRNGSSAADYTDIREDRVVFYVTASSNLKTFTYKANAITTGTFNVPPLFAEALYDNATRAFKPQGTLTIQQ